MAGDASVFLRALDSVQDTVILARPRLMALNRQRAQVLVGERLAYLSTTSTDTTTTQTVQYLDTGVKLMFRPFISNDGSIRMEIYPSVSQATRKEIGTTAGGVVKVPDEFTNEITTNVRIRDGETLVLGGLFQEQTHIANSQVPFLGDLPLLGAAFQGYDNTVERREIIFLITPTIVHDELIRSSGELGHQFVKELRVGAREGLLPWSRERRSAQHNQDALQAMDDGKFELAMFHIDSSLRLNPVQPQIKHLRRQVSEDGDVEYYDADLWDSALADMIRAHRDANGAEAPEEAPQPEQPEPEPEPEPEATSGSSASIERPKPAASPLLTALLNELERESTVEVAEENEIEFGFKPDEGTWSRLWWLAQMATDSEPVVATVLEEEE
jgi:type IV pilus assembly protein PilQ